MLHRIHLLLLMWLIWVHLHWHMSILSLWYICILALNWLLIWCAISVVLLALLLRLYLRIFVFLCCFECLFLLPLSFLLRFFSLFLCFSFSLFLFSFYLFGCLFLWFGILFFTLFSLCTACFLVWSWIVIFIWLLANWLHLWRNALVWNNWRTWWDTQHHLHLRWHSWIKHLHSWSHVALRHSHTSHLWILRKPWCHLHPWNSLHH